MASATSIVSNAASYTIGECTYGAALLAPWIPAGLGNADTWVPRAKAKGLPTGTIPVIGAAMVFVSGYPGSQGYGHVGIVRSISKNGYPVIEEMNARRDGGGKGIFDTYQTSGNDVAYLEGYVYPPGTKTAAASPITASTLANNSGPPTTAQGILGSLNIPFTPGYNPLLPPFFFNPVSAADTATGTDITTGQATSATLFSGAITFVEKGGELLIGIVVFFVGVYLIAKDAGGPSVTNVIGKIPSVAKIGAMV